MSDVGRPAPSEAPKLPWFGTIVLLFGVIVVALVRPFMPHGIIELGYRLAGRPLTLAVGHGRSVTLVEERPLTTDCQVSDVGWSPDGTILVTSCSKGLQAWTLDGHEIGTAAAEWPLHRLQVLAHPFRIAYIARSTDTSVRNPIFMIWNVSSGISQTQTNGLRSFDKLIIDHDRVVLALDRAFDRYWKLILLPLEAGKDVLSFQVPSATHSLCLIPGSRVVLLGGYDGVLRAADILTGDVRKLARPYVTSFAGGGDAVDLVNGLVPAPDGKSVALFKTGGIVTPTLATGKIDRIAAEKWEASLGTGVEIRSIDDGRLLNRMPGRELGAIDLAWDPLDRFIAVMGRDALFLWQREIGSTAIRTLDAPGVSNRLSITKDGTLLAIGTARGVRIFRIVETGTSAEMSSSQAAEER